MSKFAKLVKEELKRARAKHPEPLNSVHESYAVIMEELDEFWDEAKGQNTTRSNSVMLAELVQVAAMCQRAAEDVLHSESLVIGMI